MNLMAATKIEPCCAMGKEGAGEASFHEARLPISRNQYRCHTSLPDTPVGHAGDRCSARIVGPECSSTAALAT